MAVRSPTAADLIAWAGTLPVPSGDGAGDPWTVLPWQRKVLAAIVRPGVQTIAASCGRANGKTALGALIARAFLPGGPMYAKGRRVLIVSVSHARAREVIDDLETWREDGWMVSNNHQTARVKAGGASVRAMAANPKTAHGARPDLLICDELAQWQQADRLYAALRTGLGKRPGSRLLAVGTRPEAGSGHVFDRLLSAGADVALTYAATPADEKAGRLGWRRTWKRANPSLDVLPSLEVALRAEWREAQDDDQAMARFKSLRLNMGTPDTAESLLISPAAWARCETDTLPPADGGYALGIDLGSGAAMSGAAAYHPQTGRLDALAVFGGVPDLHERGRADRVGDLYVRMAAGGELLTQPDRRVPSVSEFLRVILDRWGPPSCIVADRWREKELCDALEASGCPMVPLVVRGMGFLDGSADVRAFRRAVLSGKVSVLPSLLVRAAMAEARTVSDPAGNWKQAKGSQGGRRRQARDDVASAAILAIAEGSRSYQPPSVGQLVEKVLREVVATAPAVSGSGARVFGPGA